MTEPVDATPSRAAWSCQAMRAIEDPAQEAAAVSATVLAAWGEDGTSR